MSIALSLPPTYRDDEPPRPAPRRTYGRQREMTPTEDTPTTSLFVAVSESSPAKGLLNRWSAASTSWKDSLPMLGSEGSDGPESDKSAYAAGPSRDVRAKLTDFRREATEESDHEEGVMKQVMEKPVREAQHAASDDNDEDDLEMIKREMDRMRREARGEVAAPGPAVIAPSTSKSLQVPAAKVGNLFTSSSLTSIPTSSPKPKDLTTSSPHLLVSDGPSHATEEETIPIRKSGVSRPSGRRPRIVASDSEEDGDTTVRRVPPAQLPSSPPVPAFSAISPPSARSRSPLSPSPRRHTSSRPKALARRSASPHEDEDDEQLGTMDDFFAELQDEQDHEGQAEEQDARADHSSSAEPVGLFNDELESHSKGKKPKGLNKKDLKLMQSGLAENRRNRAVEISKPEVQRLPISSWMALASSVIQGDKGKDAKQEVPGLLFGHSSPATSPAHKTPSDEIAAFTPSSDMRRLGVKDSVHMPKMTSDPTSSSPTPHMSRGGIRAPSSHIANHPNEDETLPDLVDMMDQEALRAQNKHAKKLAVERLRERKAAALKALRGSSHDSDDDFEILPDEPAPSTVLAPAPAVKVEQGRKQFPDAKAVLNKSSDIPAISKQKQALLRRAGKLAKAKAGDVTETFLDFAGKAFDHSNMKRANGGAVPAGQKQGRDVVIPQDQVYRQLFAKHHEQMILIQKKKEEDWGKVRALPQRQERDYSALIEASAKARPVKEESEEEDDDDFVPEGEDEDEAEEGEEEEGDEVLYSGEDEDEEDGGDEDHVSERDIGDAEMDKENKPDQTDDANDDEEQLTIIRRKPRASNRVAFESDDEEDEAKTPKATGVRPALAEVPQSTPVSNTEGFDLAGFGGSGSDSPGFSQLFEATQAGGEEEQDAFANMRDQAPFALMPANALLPGVDISETQAAKDNALIAAEVDAAMEDIYVETQPKQKYLNEQGFFTQTKPTFAPTQRENDESQTSSLRRRLAGASDFSLMGDPLSATQGEQMPSSTEKGTSALNPRTSSPTQEGRNLTRLRYRSSPEAEDLMDLEPTPADIAPRNAFDRMMKASKRVEKRAEERRAAVNSNLVDVQAEESDEDGGWAPIGGDGSDEESVDGEEGYVPDLVDDQAVDEEEKKRQDELAAEKAREIEAADDAKREAEARKVAEGQYRIKKRGLDFYSDDEDDEEGGGGRRRKWSKRERRKRRLEKEDGLDKLDGEANVFRQAYEEDLISDTETVEDETLPQRDLTPEPESLGTLNKPAWFILRERAKLNRGKDLSRQDEDLDRELGFDQSGSGFKIARTTTSASLLLEEEEDVVMDLEEESQFSIKRSMRSTTSITLDPEDDPLAARRLGLTRSTDAYAQYLREESQTNRRGVGVGAVSVTGHGNATAANGYPTRIQGSRQSSGSGSGSGNRPPARQGSGSSGGSILMSKSNRFA